jgi:hypothetical protein
MSVAETLYVYTAVMYNVMDMSNVTNVTIWMINNNNNYLIEHVAG